MGEQPTLAEDLLLVLFQPDSGTIAGENTLFYVLAGAVLAELALDERVTSTTAGLGVTSIRAVDGRAPADPILRSAWDHVSGKAHPVQTVLPAIGPPLRQPLLDRLISRGDIRREKRKALGLFDTTVLIDGGSGRRSELLRDVRAFLVDGAEPTPRVAALAGLLWGSGTLPQFDAVIPWSSAVIARAQQLERDHWGAGAVAEAVTRTFNAIISSSILIATTALRR
ncbi:GOLPH3/VPS74 family protein [Microbacterium sp.]|uniref:GOLPH3/VPS74 family protein n=1 Tax=Microbacterium sp. TaxID=51671 RepID=UPI003C726BA7